MLSRGWRMGALAVGAMIACAGTASAGDDVKSLKLTASSALVNDGDSLGLIEEGRALPQDDITDVNLRYRLGYNRGYNGGFYVLPRFYAFRAGFNDGFYGRGFGASYYWGGPRWWGGYYPRYGYGGYYGGSYYYSSYVYPSCGCYSTPVYSTPYVYGSASSSTYSLSDPNATYIPSTQPMATPEPPLSRPAPQLLPEPAPKMNYRYNGDPLNPVPQPSKQPAVHRDSEGRLVSMPATKKHSYAAYGEKSNSNPDAALLVKHP